MIREGRTLLIPTVAAGDYPDSPVAHVPNGKPVTYRVRRGDTLYGIAQRYGTTAQSIADASGIRVDKLLQVGERLTVVPGSRTAHVGSATHTVRSGDTLWRIASLYRTTVDDLCRLNRISRETVLQPGDKLAVSAR
jgi:LysM repeat protein